jgi:hypothetical protein
MAGPLLHTGAGITCTHTAPCNPVTTNARVTVSGMPVLLATDQFPVAGCPFQIPVPGGTKPSPCLTIRWTAPSARVKVMGAPVLTALSAGLGQSLEQAPQGPAVIAGVQPRVNAT